MILTKKNLKEIKGGQPEIPGDQLFLLPEKVLQFGTGVLLRGLPDYFIDKANKQGCFNGRIVVVKSTGNGDTTDFDRQDGLYTIAVKGIEQGRLIDEKIISSAISRVVSAEKHWPEILEIAASADLEVILSNTTEVGIQYIEEDIFQHPPVSFPGKLLAVLYHRYQASGSRSSGLVIIPTELIPDNGHKLKEIILRLAEYNQLEQEFTEWLHTANSFCNSLVDRIVPGKPDTAGQKILQDALGYEDDLLIIAEPYRLWAIAGDKKVADVLSFMQADDGVVVTPDIELFKELKLRLLNGTHTLTCGIAFLSGIETVHQGMENEQLREFTAAIMQQEIAAAIPYPLPEGAAAAFAATVIDRFSNPYIRHLWHSITVQYSMKMKIRVLPVLFHYYSLFNRVPQGIAFGFAAYLFYMRATQEQDGNYYGVRDGQAYRLTDDSASYFYTAWKDHQASYPDAVLKDEQFWGKDLRTLEGFIPAVTAFYYKIEESGMKAALETVKVTAQKQGQ